MPAVPVVPVVPDPQVEQLYGSSSGNFQDFIYFKNKNCFVFFKGNIKVFYLMSHEEQQ